MNTATARRVIEEELAGIYVNVPVSWPNAPFDPVAELATHPFAGGVWIKSDIIWGDGFMLTKDGRDEGTNLVVGVLQLSYYQQRDVGDGVSHELVELARGFINRRQLSAGVEVLRFGASSGTRVTDEESWRVMTVTTPFSFTETVTIVT